MPNRHVATALARAAALECRALVDVGAGGLAAETALVAMLDLHDVGSVREFRRAMGHQPPPLRRRWLFVVPHGPARHAAEVQANALGATDHIVRANAPAELRRHLSIANLPPVSPDKVRELQHAAGGHAIIAAHAALAGLFGRLADGGRLAMGDLADIGASVVDSIRSVGANEWLTTVRAYHEGTFQHCLLVTGTAAGFATRHKLGHAAAARLTLAALLHDIGKSEVPLYILDKPGRLTEAEFAIVKTHPAIGHAYLSRQPGIDPQVLDAVLHHHEALDGSGYPHGLRGEQIAPLTRVLTVCDIYAALAEARPYKPARPVEEAVSILVAMALQGKVDYPLVRSLAQALGMDPPATIEEVRANLADPGAIA